MQLRRPSGKGPSLRPQFCHLYLVKCVKKKKRGRGEEEEDEIYLLGVFLIQVLLQSALLTFPWLLVQLC